MRVVYKTLAESCSPFLIGGIAGFSLACMLVSSGTLNFGLQANSGDSGPPVSDRVSVSSVGTETSTYDLPGVALEPSVVTAGSGLDVDVSSAVVQPDLELVIPTSATIDEAKAIVVNELSKLNGVVQGGDKPSVIALIDPLCPVCQTMFSDYQALARDLEISIYWVPTDATLQSRASREYSTYMIDLLNSNRHEEALSILRRIVAADYDVSLMPPIPESWTPSKDAEYALNRASIVLGQLQAGTPLVIFSNEHGELKLMEGKPTADEFLAMRPVLQPR